MAGRAIVGQGDYKSVRGMRIALRHYRFGGVCARASCCCLPWIRKEKIAGCKSMAMPLAVFYQRYGLLVLQPKTAAHHIAAAPDGEGANMNCRCIMKSYLYGRFLGDLRLFIL